MKKTNLKWVTGNSKLAKTKTIAFSIPAFRSADGFVTCPSAGTCASLCYARQGFFTMASAQKPREENLIATKQANFIALANDDLARLKPKTVRIHDSGDFYSQVYLNAWIAIAQANPTILFYAYTKSLTFDFAAVPANLKVTQSQGGLHDNLIDKTKGHAVIFPTVEALNLAGYLDGSVTDELAQRGATKIGLVYHGTRKLTDKQKEGLAL